MGLLRLILAVATIGWWAAFYRNPEAWAALVAALAFTISWVVLMLSDANRRVDQMVDPVEEGPDDPR